MTVVEVSPRQRGVEALSWSSRPRWTGSHLRQVLAAAYGVDGGGPDVAAAAVELGVREATVRAWCRAGGRQRARIRPETVGRLVAPPPEVERRRRQQVDYARTAAAGLARSKGRSATAAWSAKGWLHEHLVIVATAGDGRVHQCHVVRRQSRLHTELVRRRQIVAARLEPNYFAATVVAGDLLDVVAPWRVYPGPGQVTRGRTACWLPGGPAKAYLLSLGPS